MVEAYQNSLLDFVSTKQKIICEYGQEGERWRTKLIQVPALTTANMFFPGDSHLKNDAREDLRKLREDVFPSSPSQLIGNLAVARRTWDSLAEKCLRSAYCYCRHTLLSVNGMFLRYVSWLMGHEKHTS